MPRDDGFPRALPQFGDQREAIGLPAFDHAVECDLGKIADRPIKRLYRDGCDSVLKCSPRLSTSHVAAVLIQIRFGAWAGNSPGHKKLLIFAPLYFAAVELMQNAWLSE
jgi:hypothetical protein